MEENRGDIKRCTGVPESKGRYSILLVGEGIGVGIVAGLVAILYRLALGRAEGWMRSATEAVRQNGALIAVWFLALAALSYAVYRIVKFEPMISGSGIPQLEGEVAGDLDPCWWKVILAKMVGGVLCILGGLSLGREGPSIQLGAMAGKAFSKLLRRPKGSERFLVTCGASAGLAAAFNAPLAGILFAVEEVHKSFSGPILLSVMSAAVASDFLSKHVFGLSPVFSFPVEGMVPLNLYWLVAILGILLGVLGAFYNKVTMVSLSLYDRILPKFRLLIPFLTAGVLALCLPQVLGGGHRMIDLLAGRELALGGLLFLLMMKFLFSVLSFGSGAPGGIFFPLLVLGAFLGGGFSMAATELFGVPQELFNNFIILAMAGYFTAIVRAPITGIILITEMTGAFDNLLGLSVVSVLSYFTATILGSEPIYDRLLGRIKNRVAREKGKKEMRKEAAAVSRPDLA